MRLIYLLVDFENLQPTAQEFALIRGDQYRLWIFRGPHQNKYDAAMAEAWQPLGDRVKFVQSTKAGKNALDFHIAFCMGGLLHEHVAAGLAPATAPRFIVISKDGGFDALFDLVKLLGCTAAKAANIPDALRLCDADQPGQTRASPASTVAVATQSADSAKVPPIAGQAVPVKTPQPAKSPAPAKKVAKKTATKTMQAAKPLSAAEIFEKVIAYLRAHPNNRPTTRAALERHIPSMVGGKATPERTRSLVAKLESAGIAKFSGKEIEYKMSKGKKVA